MITHNHLQNSLHHQVNDLSCDRLSFFSSTISLAEKCKLASTLCDDKFDFVNFYKIGYCWIDGNIILSIILGIILILLIFSFISHVVEEYLAPSIAYISEWLELPEALAAVTLLALANGAGDVITALVASGSSEGLSYNIGSIYGAGFFVCSMVVAMTINSSSTDIQLEPSSIWRDVGFYIIATLTVIFFGVQGELSYISALVLMIEYVLLVFFVWYQESNKPQIHDEEEKDNKIQKPDLEHNQRSFEQLALEKQKKLQEKNLIPFPDNKTNDEEKVVNKWKAPLSKLNTATASSRLKILTAKLHSVVFLALAVKSKFKQEQKEEEDFNELSLLDKIFYILNVPFDYLRRFTLPPCENEKWNRMQAVLFPLPFLIFVVFVFTLDPKIWWLYLIPIGLSSSAYIYFNSNETEIPSYYIILEFAGSIGALTWTYIVSGILIDLLNFLGMVLKLDSTFMGLTVIAVGNALPDAVTTIALAKQGYAIMGLTGAYAGQLFGLLIGFGSALFKKTLTDGPQKFNIFDQSQISENLMNLAVIMVSLINLIITFIYGISNKYKYSSFLAKIIGGLYISFVSLSTIYAIKKALD